MKIIYIDAFSGISGDKMVGALLQIIGDNTILKNALLTLKINNEFDIEINNKKVMGINSLKFNVNIKHSHHHRNINDIKNIIDNSKINANVKKISTDIFHILAKAESLVHDMPIDEVHFHEVGAIDSIVDIISAAVLIDHIKPDSIYCSDVAVGSGFVKTEHGLLPVPAPATVQILKDIPIYAGDIKTELTTPTGAAIIKYLVKNFIDLPKMNINSIGYGAGTKDLEIPNVLRIYLGEILDSSDNVDYVVTLQTNIDDCSPEQIGFLFERLMNIGALDVFLTPILMKKNRLAQLLTVICKEDKEAILENEIFKNTTTFGIRKTRNPRSILRREIKTITVEGVQINVKLGFLGNELIQKSLEYESIKNACSQMNLNYNEVVRKAAKIIEESL